MQRATSYALWFAVGLRLAMLAALATLVRLRPIRPRVANLARSSRTEVFAGLAGLAGLFLYHFHIGNVRVRGARTFAHAHKRYRIDPANPAK